MKMKKIIKEKKIKKIIGKEEKIIIKIKIENKKTYNHFLLLPWCKNLY